MSSEMSADSPSTGARRASRSHLNSRAELSVRSIDSPATSNEVELESDNYFADVTSKLSNFLGSRRRRRASLSLSTRLSNDYFLACPRSRPREISLTPSLFPTSRRVYSSRVSLDFFPATPPSLPFPRSVFSEPTPDSTVSRR